MNLWVFNHYAITPDMPGGTRHYDLSKELVKRGHQVVIFASSFSHKQHREAKLRPGERWRIEDVNGMKFVWLRTFPYQSNDWRRVVSMVSYMLCARRLGRKLSRLTPEVGKPDVVIGSSVHILAVLAAYWVAKHYRARFMMEIRDLWPQTIIDMGKISDRNPVIKILQFLERFLYRRAKRIVTLLPLAYEYIMSCGIPRDKIVWIPNGVDLSRFTCIKADKLDKQFKVMYLGAHGQANALDVLLEAARAVQDKGYDDIRFILIGDGPEKPKLIELAQALSLKNVEFRIPVRKAQVPQALSEADVTVSILNDLSLYRYGISLNKLFDYAAAGKPLILAGSPANNIVEEAQCGITVPPRDPQALAEAIIKLYRMPPPEREAMGQRGREYVERYHSISVLADKLESCLKEVIE